MRKNFLLVFLLALLPMAGWAHNVSWTGNNTVYEVDWTGTPVTIPGLVVTSSSGNVSCSFSANSVEYPTGNNVYNYTIHTSQAAAENGTDPITSVTDQGVYYVRVSVRARTGGNGTTYNPYRYGNDRKYLTLKVIKPATVTGFSLQGGLIYDGTLQNLISGNPTFPNDYQVTTGGVKFIVNDGIAPAATATGEDDAEAENAGTYHVWVKPLGDGDFYKDGDWESLGSVKISKAPFTESAKGYVAPAPLAETPTYSGALQTLFTPGTAPAGGTITYSLTSGGTYGNVNSVRVENVADANKVYYKVSESDNYLASEELSIDVAMEPYPLRDPVTAGAVLNAPFNNGLQTLVTTQPSDFRYNQYYWSAQAGTLTYSYGTKTDVALAEVQEKDFGEYVITYTFTPTNTNFKSVTKVLGTAKITTADNAIETTWAKIDDVTYPADPTITTPKDIFGNEATLTFTKNGEDVAQPAAGEWTAGAWTVTATVEAAANGNYAEATATKNFTIERAGLDIAAQSLNVNYGTTVVASDLIKADEDFVNGETPEQKAAIVAALVQIKSIDGGTADNLPTDAGTYNFVLEATSADGNYEINDFVPNGVLNIKKVDAVAATVTGASLPYTGDAQTLITVDEKTLVGGTMEYSLDGENWSAELPKGTDVAIYPVSYRVKVDKNHNEIAVAVENGEIYKVAAVVVDPEAAENLVYTGGPLNLIKEGTGTSTQGKWYYKLDGGEYAETIPTGTDADSYEVFYKFVGDKNHEDIAETSFTVTIDPKDITVDDFTVASHVFTAAKLDPMKDVVVTTALEKGVDFDINSTKDLFDADTYTLTFNGKGNYTGTIEKDFEITVADIAAEDLTDPTEKKDLIYNGGEQALIVAAKAKIPGYFVYSLDGENYGKADVIPTAKDAGEYTVYTKFVSEPANYDDNSRPIESKTVTIHKMDIMYQLGNTDKVWDGATFTDEKLTEAYTLTAGSLQGADISEIPFTITMPKDAEGNDITDAGEYTFAKLVVVPAEPKNYNVNFTGTAKLTINQAPLEEDVDFKAPGAIENLKFDGSTMALVTAGELLDTKYATAILFSEEKEGTYTKDVIKKSDAGDYSVWYYVEGDKNHKATEPVEIKNSIAAALIADALPAKLLSDGFTATYNAKNQEFTIAPEGLDLYNKDTKEGDYVIEPYEIKNAGSYNITITGKNNYEGSSALVPVTIDPAPLMVTAPSAKKTYDATNVVEKDEFEAPIFNGLLDPDKLDLGDANAYVTIPADAINWGTYELTMEEATVTKAIPEPKNYKVIAVLPGTLTIEKVKKAKLGFQKDFTYSKVYGAKDPEYTKVTNASKLIGDEAFADNDRIAAIYSQLTITRPTVGVEEDVTEKGKGYEVSLGLVDPSTLEEDEYYFADNYETLELGTTILQVTPATLTISIASASKTYDGKVASYGWADDLSNMVVAGLPEGKDKAEIFTADKMPSVSIVDPSANAGDYNVELGEEYESKNYTVTLLPGSYYTIEPVYINAKFNTPVAVEGDDANVIFNKVIWSVEADEDVYETEDAIKAAQKTIDANKALFKMQFTDGVVAGGKIATDDGEDALVVKYLGTETPANFEFIEAYGDLNIGGENTEIALDDSKAIVTKATKKADVTFTQKRAVPEDVWQACVLPFTVSIEDLSDAFGYAAVDLFDKSRTNSEEVHFSLQVTGSIEAGTPFLFKTNNSTNFTDVMFEGVEVVDTETLDPVVKDDDTNIQFIGTFEPVEFYGEQYRYLSKGTWYNAKNFSASKPVSLKPLRAYLNMEGAATARIFIEEPDGTVTAIDAVEFNNQAAEGLYNLNGMKVNQGLKGVYIQNGKKVIK